MLKTVIGSFPKLNLSLEKAIEKVVDLQLRHSIDILSDGEQRGNMFEYFSQVTEIDETKKTVKIKTIENLNEFYKIVDFFKVKSYLDSVKSHAKVKITLTGPLTLGRTLLMRGYDYSPSISTASLLNPNYKRQKLYSDISKILVPIAKKCLEIGAFLQIDEPGISSFNLPLNFVRKTLEEFFEPLKKDKLSIHVCGNIKKEIYDILLGLNLNTISLELDEIENMKIISKKSLEDNEKKLGAGIISNVSIEDEQALKRLRQIANVIGLENIECIHPFCGFRNTPIENIELILSNMKKVSETFMREEFKS